MLLVFTRNWWVLAIRGSIALAFGVIAFLWPGVALTALALLFAACALLDGILSLIAAYWRAARSDRWWMLVVEGLVGIVVAVFTIAWPALTVLALVYLAATWAIVTGALEILAAKRLRRYLQGEWVLALAGAASALFGVLLVISPTAGQIVLAWWIGAYAIFFGATMLVLAAKLRRWARAVQCQPV
jgi:uncharacterized membrane protein HdeD (DUF308 family)